LRVGYSGESWEELGSRVFESRVQRRKLGRARIEVFENRVQWRKLGRARIEGVLD
jgi:hypothetical protein